MPDFWTDNGYDPNVVQRVGTGQGSLPPDARRGGSDVYPPGGDLAGFSVPGYGQPGNPWLEGRSPDAQHPPGMTYEQIQQWNVSHGLPLPPGTGGQQTQAGAQPFDRASAEQQIRQMYAQRGIPIGANDETNWIPLWLQRAEQGGGFGAIQPELAASLGGGNPFSLGTGTGGFGGTLPGAPGTFTPTPFNFKFDPTTDDGYQFTLNQGLDALQRRQSSLGTGLTGGAMRDLTDYASGVASQEYGNQFNRALQTNQLNNQYGLLGNQNQFNQALGTANFGLGSQNQGFNQGLATNQNIFNQGLLTNQNAFNQNLNLANLGLNATNSGINGANGVANMATGYANSAGGLLGDLGNAQAAGTIGSSNARNQLYGNLANLAASYPWGQ